MRVTTDDSDDDDDDYGDGGDDLLYHIKINVSHLGEHFDLE